MPIASRISLGKSGALVATLLLALPLAGADDPAAMLVVLKNQPARQIIASLLSPATATSLADADFKLAKDAETAKRALQARQRFTQEAAAAIRAATTSEQDLLAGKLTALGAAGIRRYVAINMVGAQIPQWALDSVKQWPEVAEVMPVGTHQELLDSIEQNLSNPRGLVVPTIGDNDEPFLRLCDRIIDDHDLLLAAAPAVSAFNAIPAAPYSDDMLHALGTFSHLPVKAAQINGAGSISFSDTLSTDRPYRFYTGRAQNALHASLAWDRHFGSGLEPTLRSLSLMVYHAADGAEAASEDTGELVVKVRLLPSSDDPVSAEPFAVAASEANFVVAQGPKLAVDCSPDCTVRNKGDLPAFNVIARAQGTDYPLGTIGAGANVQFGAGLHIKDATATSNSFGETFTASTGDPCMSGWQLSAASVTLNDSNGRVASVSVAPPLGCTKQWGAWISPSSANMFITLSAPLGPVSGGGSVVVQGDASPVLITGTVNIQDATFLGPGGPAPFATFGVADEPGSRTPSVTLSSPKAGATFVAGTDSMVITWAYDAGLPPRRTTGTIELISGSTVARTISSLVTLAPPGGGMNWPVPSDLAAGAYSVRIRPGDTSIPAADAGPVQVNPQPPPLPDIFVTAPPKSTTTTVVQGGSVSIVFHGHSGKSAPNAGKVDISLIDPAGKSPDLPIATNVPMKDGVDTTYVWTVPVTQAAGSYKIRVKLTDYSNFDDSGVVTITASGEIQMTGPSDCVKHVGDFLTITWKKKSGDSAAKATFFLGTYKLGEELTSKETLTVTIPTGVPDGPYQIVVTGVAKVTGNTGTVTIQTDEIQLVSPGIEAFWQIGTTQTIQWKGNVSPVTIKIFVDGKVITLPEQKDKAGSYPWKIPMDIPANRYTLQASGGSAKPAERVVSFFFPKIQMVWPSGEWEMASSQKIDWKVIGNYEDKATLNFTIESTGAPLKAGKVNGDPLSIPIREPEFKPGMSFTVKVTLTGSAYSFTDTSTLITIVPEKQLKITSAQTNGKTVDVTFEFKDLGANPNISVGMTDAQGLQAADTVQKQMAGNKGSATVTLTFKKPAQAGGTYTVTVFLTSKPSTNAKTTVTMPAQ